MVVVKVLDELGGGSDYLARFASADHEELLTLADDFFACLLAHLLQIILLRLFQLRAFRPVQTLKHGQRLFTAVFEDVVIFAGAAIPPHLHPDLSLHLADLRGMLLIDGGLDLLWLLILLLNIHALVVLRCLDADVHQVLAMRRIIACLMARGAAIIEALSASKQKVMPVVKLLLLALPLIRDLLIINQVVNHELVDLIICLIKIGIRLQFIQLFL